MATSDEQNYSKLFANLLTSTAGKDMSQKPKELYIGTPKDFKFENIKDKEVCPPAKPTKWPPFKSISEFKEVDKHAREVADFDHESMRDLLWHLLYSKSTWTDLQKVRAMFIWLCCTKLAKLNFKVVKVGTPEHIMMTLNMSGGTYAKAFETLCHFSGIHCVTATGYVKGEEAIKPIKSHAKQGQHSWNAVLVNGNWQLVDVRWAKSKVVSKQDTGHAIDHELDEYYFMPDPNQLIFSHFPLTPEWQLLEKPLIMDQFAKLAAVKPLFFSLGLQVLNHREMVITSSDGDVEVKIGCPPAKAATLLMMYSLTFESGQKQFDGNDLKYYGMQEMVDNVFTLKLRLPSQGNYMLALFSRDTAEASKDETFQAVCIYKIICRTKSTNPKTFPMLQRTFWGPTEGAERYPVTPSQKNATYTTTNGKVDIKIETNKFLNFKGKLKGVDQDDKLLAGFMVQRTVGEAIIFTITPPSNGEYGLEVYLGDPEKDGNSLCLCYQYLIIARGVVKAAAHAIPSDAPVTIGPSPIFKSLSLTASSHPDPFIIIDSQDMDITFDITKKLRVSTNLIALGQRVPTEYSNYVLQQKQGTDLTFRLRFPKTGFWELKIYALPHSDSPTSMPEVFSYLIKCTKSSGSVIPFPMQYSLWKEGCFLHEPLEGHIKKGSGPQELMFKLDIPGAREVALTAAKEFVRLEKNGVNTWEGGLKMAQFWGNVDKVSVIASYEPSGKPNYKIILEYSL